MKINNNFYKIIAALFISTLLLTSCNNETVEDVEEVFNINGLEVLSYSFKEKGVSGKGLSLTTIAAFDSQQTYDNYVNNLESQVEAWDDAFVAKWGYLNDDELNAKEEELNFDSEKPLTDFENQIGLQSLRQKYLADEEVWLNNEVLDEATAPDNNSIYDFDQSKMALINRLGEVKIGITIIKQLTKEQITNINGLVQLKGGLQQRIPADESAYLTIDDGNFDTLVAFNEGDVSVVNDNNVTVVQNSDTSCKNSAKRVFTDEYASGKKVILKVKFDNVGGGLFFKAKAKIKSFKQKSSGKWKRYRTNLGVEVATNQFCDDFYQVTKSMKRKRRKKLKRTITRVGVGNLKARSDGESVIGGFEYGGKSEILRLTW
tara:strand:- start:3258 stop:4379 length:1122 start_codon:yes stop_codon:yes gene_type:complete